MKTLTILLLTLFTLSGLAQEKTISGSVTSASDGLPLPGVNITIKGTAKGAQTDFDGNYTILTNTGDTLIFSYVGQKTQEVIVGKSNIINVALGDDGSALEEVIVTAQAVRREKNTLSSSVTTVKAESIEGKSETNIIRVLSGQVSGLNISTASNNVGSNTRIVLRGNSSINSQNKPLIIIDGIISSEEQLKKIKSRKVEELKIAKNFVGENLYGEKGKYGVIFVKTKRSNYIMPNINKLENEAYSEIHENKFKRVSLSPLSTFSIDVDKAAYSNIRRMINNGQDIPADAVKIEEMVNYFKYDYPQPTNEHPFSINTEVAKTPWNKDTKIVKIGLQGKTYKNEELPASNLTFLIDVSGSMSNVNKLPLLKSAFKLLVNQLREKDKVSIVVYAGAAGVVLEPTSGNNKEKIIAALNNLNSGGSTAGGAGIKLAYALAEKSFKKNGNNRVILATDGDFNVGASSDKDMKSLIEEKRKSGVFLSVLGFGYGNYKDSKLETLADKGNGNHAYIDTMQEAQKVFGKEFGGTLYTIAKDVKIQLEFNPAKVQAYRLIGYENRLLEDEDFSNDKVDAGELGSGHTVTALYEVIPVGVESKFLKDVADLKYTKNQISDNASNELFTVKFRYKKPDEDKSIEMIHIQNDIVSEASEDLKFASAIALFGMQLKHSKYFNNASISDVVSLAKSGKGKDEDGYRSEFLRLVKSL